MKKAIRKGPSKKVTKSARPPGPGPKVQKKTPKQVDLSDVIPRNPETGRVPLKYWTRKSNRVRAIRALVERCGLPLHELRISHFLAYGLYPLLIYYPIPKRLSALKEAGYELTDEVLHKRNGPYGTSEKRRKSAQDLAKRLGKEVYELSTAEVRNASLGSLLYWSGGLRNLMRDCGHDPDIIKKPRGYWSYRANRKKAVMDVMKATGKRPEELTEQDFLAHGAGQIFIFYRKPPRDRRLKLILSDVGLSEDVIEPDEWGLPPKGLPGRWEDVSKKERVRILQRIAEKLGKNVEDLVFTDIVRFGFIGLILIGPDAPRSFPELLRWAGVDHQRMRKKRGR
jgi:hypothetical protein